MQLPAKIDSFSGEWDFLSNFYLCVVEYEGIKYASVEHAYQAAKTLDLKKREVLSLDFNPNLHPGHAKRIGRKLKLRPDWEEIKISVMRELLIQKFSQPRLRQKLLSMMNVELIEGNWWHDTFWGVCTGRDGRGCYVGPHEPYGENQLGTLLMEVRSLIASMPLLRDEPWTSSDSSDSTLATLPPLLPGELT